MCNNIVIFIDDEPDLLEVAEFGFEDIKYELAAFKNGKDAISYFEKNQKKVCLIITDFNMPSMNGVDLTIQLRKICDKIPILLATGSVDKGNEQSFKNVGITDFMYKPYDTDIFEQIFDKFSKKS